MDRLFLPFITDDQGKTLELENGVVVPKINPNPINQSPEGWEDNVIQLTRNKEFVGVIKAYTTTLKFFSEAATILRTIAYTKGIEVVLFFIWLKLDLSFGGGMKYKDWYKGEFDLSTFKDGYDGVQANIIEGGFYKELQANKNITYEIPFDENTASVEMDGIELFNKLNYAIAPDVLYESSAVITIAAPFISSEGTNTTVEVGSPTLQNYANHTNMQASENWMLKNSSSLSQEVKIKGMARFMAPENGTLPKSFVGIKFSKTTSLENFNGWAIYAGNPTANAVIEIPLNYTIVLDPGESLFLSQHQNSVNYNLFNIVFLEGSEIIVDFASIKEKTIIDALRTYDAGNKLCKFISKDVSVLKSDLLENDYNLLITCGDAIRGISNSVIKTKMTDWHKSVHAVKCISFNVENNNGRLEKRKYAFSDVEITDLGEVKIGEDFLEPANEYRYSSIEVGYPTKDIGSLNGKYSFNNTLIFKTPKLKGGENIYDAKSLYYSDPYIIETIRINLEGKKTTDNQSDNDVFFLDCEKVYSNYVGNLIFSTIEGVASITLVGVGKNLKIGVRFRVISGLNTGAYKISYVYESGGNTIIQVEGVLEDDVLDSTVEFNHYRLRRKEYLSIEGVPAPNTVFNIELSPRRILNEHLEWLSGACDKLIGFLTYQTTEKNSELITTDLNNFVIKEKADISIATLGTKIILPYFFNFEAISQINLYDKVKANPGGYFTFTFNNTEYRGFIDDIKTNEATLETQDYRLICKGDNNLETLIYNR